LALTDILVPVALFGILALAFSAIRSASRPPSDCLGCGAPLAVTDPVPRSDLRLCPACVDAGIHAIYNASSTSPSPSTLDVSHPTRCHFCGQDAARNMIVVPLRQAAICSSCLYTCQAFYQDPPIEAVESQRRRTRDQLINGVLTIFGMGLWVAMMARGCPAP
jgi:hypothetical protein